MGRKFPQGRLPAVRGRAGSREDGRVREEGNLEVGVRCGSRSLGVRLELIPDLAAGGHW